MKERKIFKKLHNLYSGWKPLCLLILLILGIFMGSSFAKYYSLQKQKGVALASEFHFSSDVLKKGVTLGEDGIPTSLSPYVGANVWNVNGTSSKVNFVIRNYANFLLYNDENVEIEYDMYAMITEEDNSGIEYYLNYGEEHSVALSTVPVKISDSIRGGEPLTNSYSVEYKYKSGIGIFPKTVYVWVVPTAPSYIPVNEFSMGSSISVQEVSTEFSFETGWGFVQFPDLDEPMTTLQMNTINAQAGFVYNISTTGTNTSGLDKDKVKVRLSWDCGYVELDRFSKYYDASQITTGADGRKTMDITVNAFTSNDILFYRTGKFTLSDFTTQRSFAELVQAEYVPEK